MKNWIAFGLLGLLSVVGCPAPNATVIAPSPLAPAASTTATDEVAPGGPASNPTPSPEIATNNAATPNSGGFLGSPSDSSDLDDDPNCDGTTNKCTKAKVDPPSTPQQQAKSEQKDSSNLPAPPPPPPPPPNQKESKKKLCLPGKTAMGFVYLDIKQGEGYWPTCFHVDKETSDDFLDHQKKNPSGSYTFKHEHCLPFDWGKEKAYYDDLSNKMTDGQMGFFFKWSDFNQPKAAAGPLTGADLQGLIDQLKENGVKVYPFLLPPKGGVEHPPANCPQ